MDPATMMAISAALQAGTSLASGAIAGNSAQDALTTQRQTLKRQMGLAAPGQDVGYNALQDLSTVFGVQGPRYRPDYYGGAMSLKPQALYPGGTAGGGAPGTPGGGDLQGRTDDFMQRFMESPIYQTIYKNYMDEGRQAYERNATAQGRLNSGRTVLGIGDMAGRAAGNSLQQYIQGLSGLSQGGAQAGGQAQNALQYGAQNIGNAQTGVGSAQAAGVMGVGNAAGNAMNNYGFLLGQQQPGATTSAYGNALGGYGSYNLPKPAYGGGYMSGM